VLGGRRLYGLPYFRAEMSQRRHDGWIHYRSRRSGDGAAFEARYRGTGAAAPAPRGSFEEWLAERYCLYSRHTRRGLLRIEVHHAPWPLEPAEVEVSEDALLATSGFELNRGEPPVCHFSAGVHVVGFAAERIRG
jgi:uncharacterized protein